MMVSSLVRRAGVAIVRVLAFAVGVSPVVMTTSAWAAPPPQTIGEVIAGAGDQPTHIIFLHGIRTDGRGASFDLQSRICGHIAGGCAGLRRVSSDVLSLGDQRPNARFDGDLIWKDGEEWQASRPIVDHYVYERPHGGPVIVDEINWWRLAFPIKCRVLVATDSRLAGVDARTLRLCAALKRDPDGGLEPAGPDYHGWLSRAQFDAISAQRPDGGGAPWINRLLKTEILDWGLSDAVIALGSTKTELRGTVLCALGAIAGFDPKRGTPQDVKDPLQPPPIDSANLVVCAKSAYRPRVGRFVIVSHSLGSFMLLDTFAAATGRIREIDEAEKGQGFVSPQARQTAPPTSPPTSPTSTALASAAAAEELCADPDAAEPGFGPRLVERTPQITNLELDRAVARHRARSLCYVVRNTYNLYFLANQVPLLEIARIEQSPSDGEVKAPDALGEGRVQDTLGDWARLSGGGRGEREQIVAFSDPGDILTYRAPCIANAVVTNVPVRNAFRWFGLVEDPGAAHTGYFKNPKVLTILFGDAEARPKASAGTPGDTCPL